MLSGAVSQVQDWDSGSLKMLLKEADTKNLVHGQTQSPAAHSWFSTCSQSFSLRVASTLHIGHPIACA